MNLKHLILSVAALSVMATSAMAEEFSWHELVGRPELWPTQCTVKETLEFDVGVVKAGQKVNVDGLNAEEVLLTTTDGRISFSAFPEETDVMQAAQEAYAKLTPKQRELTYAAIAQKKEWWPQKIALKQTFDIGGGKLLNIGDELTVLDVTPQTVRVLVESINTSFDLLPQATDLMSRVRTFVEDKNAPGRMFIDDANGEVGAANDTRKRLSVMAAGPVLNELEGKLINSVTGNPDPLDGKALPQYIVFFRGSSTCPITRQFAPEMVKFYNQMKPQHPEFEIVYMMTEDIADTAAFAKANGFAWRALPYDVVHPGAMPLSATPVGNLLPQIIVLDREGHVLANGSQATAPDALDRLAGILNGGK